MRKVNYDMKCRLNRSVKNNATDDIPFSKIQHVQFDISEHDLKWAIDEFFLKVRPHCGKSTFTKSENDLLYAILDEYTDNLSVSTVYGIPNVITLKKQITTKERSVSEIVSDLNRLIDFVNVALG